MVARPMVSVIMTTYNQASYLAHALDSVLAQDIEPSMVEVMVIDDGSTDETASMLRRYSNRVHLITQAHQGLSVACNAALAAVRGDYVARVDSDDYVHPQWLRRELEALQRVPEACCVYPDYIEVRDDGTQRRVRVTEDNLYSLMACGTLFRTGAVHAVGGVRSLYWEEYDLYLRLRAQGTFLHVATPLYWYRKHPGSLTADDAARKAGWTELLTLWGAERLLAEGSCPELLEAIATQATARCIP